MLAEPLVFTAKGKPPEDDPVAEKRETEKLLSTVDQHLESTQKELDRLRVARDNYRARTGRPR